MSAHRIARVVPAILCLAFVFGGYPLKVSGVGALLGFAGSSTASARTLARVVSLPLSFEVNRGQSDSRVRYLARGNGYTVFLTPSQAVLALRSRAGNATVIRLQPVGAASTRPAGVALLPGHVSYFLGNNPRHWHTDIPTYGQVVYRNVYPHIDLAYHGRQSQLEYDWMLAPGADVNAIRLRMTGARSLTVNRHGDLVLRNRAGVLVQGRPTVYQTVAGAHRTVAGWYHLGPDGMVRFRLGRYDRSKPLVIDPSLTYATYLGGNGDEQTGRIRVDGSGNAYVIGTTASGNFPIAGPHPSGYTGGTDVFVTKVNPAGSGLIYSAYIGGSGTDAGNGLSVDNLGNAYMTGATNSSNFPTLPAQAVPGPGQFNVWAAKLSAAGDALVFSKLLGGPGDNRGFGVVNDAQGNVYLTGQTSASPAAATHVYVAKLGPTGTTLGTVVYGGSAPDVGTAITLDPSNNVWVTGTTKSTDFRTAGQYQTAYGGGPFDAFATKLSFTTSWNVLVSVFIGGLGDDEGKDIIADGAGNVYVTGSTTSTNFPTGAAVQTALAGTSNAFLIKLNSSGGAVFSTYLGGNGTDVGTGVAVDPAGNVIVTGSTTSTSFPTAAALQSANTGGAHDAFVTKLAADDSGYIYSTYLGGTGDDQATGVAADNAGNAYVFGSTSSTDFPATFGVAQGSNHGGFDAFIAKIFDQSGVGTGAATNTPIPTSATIIATATPTNTPGLPFVTATPTRTVGPAPTFPPPPPIATNTSVLGPTATPTGTPRPTNTPLPTATSTPTPTATAVTPPLTPAITLSSKRIHGGDPLKILVHTTPRAYIKAMIEVKRLGTLLFRMFITGYVTPNGHWGRTRRINFYPGHTVSALLQVTARNSGGTAANSTRFTIVGPPKPTVKPKPKPVPPTPKPKPTPTKKPKP